MELAHQELQELTQTVRDYILANLATDRERSLAITKLDELEFWLSKTNIQR